MTTLEQVQAVESKLLLNTYARNPILFTGGHDVYLTTSEGQDYLDLLSGIGCSALGYAHPVLTAAIAKQSAQLLHTSNLFYHPFTAELATRLTDISGLDRVFLCNSGTEGLGGRAEACTRQRPRQRPRHPLPRARALVPRTHHGLRRHDRKTCLPAALCTARPRCRVHRVQRCGRAQGRVFKRDLRHSDRAHPGRRRHPSRVRRFLPGRPPALRLYRRAANRGRNPVRFRPYRQVVRLPTLSFDARCRDSCQAARWRPAHRRHAVHGARPQQP